MQKDYTVSKKKIKVAPSILAADFGYLAKEIKRIEAAGADIVHIDVMDGNFVPNITIGPVVIKYLRKITRLPLYAHLMIAQPFKYAEGFFNAGADLIAVHIETTNVGEFKRWKKKIKKLNKKLGVALNPSTPLSRIKPLLKYTDMVLVMSVNPGFSGQKFMPQVLPKVKALRKIYSGDIEIDGGINDQNAKLAVNAGVNILAAATYIFHAKNPKIAIRKLKDAR